MTIVLKERCAEQLRELEKLLRQCDNHLETAARDEKVTARKVRNSVNAACNALHRATRA